MSFVLTPESLQDISVKCVTAFITKQASLSEAVATEAKALELNPEQIKRVIETSNTLAYLRQLKDADDRTFEFPVAEYGKVMSSIAVPTSTPASNPTVVIIKEASFVEAKGEIPMHEKRALLMKQALAFKETLNKMAELKEEIKTNLEKAAVILSRDELGMEKLAQVVEAEDYDKILFLCRLVKRAEVDSVFLDEELDPSRQVYFLYKEAKALLEKEAEMTSFVKRAEEILFQKESGYVSEKLGKGVGYILGKTTKTTANLANEALNPKGFAATGKRIDTNPPVMQ